MSTTSGKIQGPAGGDKKGDGGGPCLVMAAETHEHGLSHSLPIDLAGHRSAANIVTVAAANPHQQTTSGLVQLRPVRTFAPGILTGGTVAGQCGQSSGSGAVMSGKIIGVGGSFSHPGHSGTVTSGTPTVPPGSIISVNRSGQNLTILPARLGQTAVATVTGGSSTGAISTLQFARGAILGNVRAGTLTGGSPGQPASITVTPLNPASFGTSIRLAGTVNNGSWIQASNSTQGAFTPMIRPATIQVGGRTVRPVDGKVIHIPQHSSIPHHMAQIQLVDNKGTIIKPSLSATPIVRGTIHSGGANTSGTPLTLPFTLRASIPTLHRPQTSNSPTSAQVQKVITQPAHGPPIQLVAAPKISQLQAITPIPRLNPVCLTISTPANQTANNTTPSVAITQRSGPTGTNLIMTPSLISASNIGPPVTKVYPISRELSINPVMDIVNQHGVAVAVASSASSSTGVTFSLGGGSGTVPTGHILKAHSLPSGTNTMQMQVSQGNHHLVQVQGPLGVQSGVGFGTGTILTTINPTLSGIPQTPHNLATNTSSVPTSPNYYMDHKNLNVSVIHPLTSIHPIPLDKRHLGVSMAANFSGGESKNSIMGGGTPAMILTSAPQHHPVSISHSLGPLQSHSFVHPVSVGPTVGSSVHTLNHQHLITASASTNITPHQVSIFTTPVSSKQLVTSGQHPVTITMSSVGPTTYTTHLNHGHISNSAVHSLPAHMVSTKPLLCPLPMTSVNAASILSATLTMNSNGPTGSGVGLSGSSTSTTNSASVTTTITTSTAVTITSTTTATSVSAPAQSPSQSQAQAQNTKSTLSPRPSILRKRETGVDSVPLRAQRNLALNFGGNISGVQNSLSSSVVSGVTMSASSSLSASASAAVAAAATANKENNLNTSIGGNMGLGPIATNSSYTATGNLSILKKEFQPPNEESSWQSCSSNSSSGSTTISTTSETAEIQLQQLQLHQQSVPELNVGLGSSSTMGFNSVSSISRGSEISLNGNPNPSSSLSHNGVVRVGSSTTTGGARIRTFSSGKAQIKDIERLKGKAKDDNVSPRKKPRKQQLTTSDLLESASPEISFYQGKKFKKSELNDPNLFEGFAEKLKENLPEVIPSEHIVYYIKKPHVSLLDSNKFTPRPRINHFCRYSDVKAKEERRPTINDLANQKNVFQKVTGWKLMHLTCQIDQIVEVEMNVVCSFNLLLTKLDAKVGPNCATRDLNRIQELLKGNIQRCKVIRDQMSESRSQVSKIVEHKSRVQDVINKFASKRPIKKRERL